MTDTYPIGYQQARNKFSPNFLQAFDRCIERYAPLNFCCYSSLPTVESPLFLLFLPVYIIGAPIFLILSCMKTIYDFGASRFRASLYSNLVKIAQSDDADQRIALIQQPACINALSDEVIEMGDMASCPVSLLKVLLQPENLSILRQNSIQSKRQADLLIGQRCELEQEVRTYKEKNPGSDRSPHVLQLNERIAGIRQDIDNSKSLIERIRNSGFDHRLINSIPESATVPSMVGNYQPRMWAHDARASSHTSSGNYPGYAFR